MTTLINGPFRWGILLLLLSGTLHAFAFTVGGLTQPALILIPIAGFYGLLAAGLARGWRWLGHVAFLCMLIGGVGALSNVWGDGPVPGWWYGAIAAVDALAALCFLVALWRGPAAEGGAA